MASQTLQKILYVEDEEDIRTIAQIALEDIGSLTVQYCANGYEAIQASKHFVPDLLLLDVMMPMLDGPSTLSELRKIPGFSNIPVIFMTAKIQRDEVNQYKELGAIDVISKPFDPMTLADTLKQIWAKSNGS